MGRDKEEMGMRREISAIQDSTQVEGIEGQLAREKQKQKNESGQGLNDPEEIKEQLRRALRGVVTRKVPVKNDEGEYTGEYQMKKVQVSSRQLCNQKGFDTFWATIEGAVNKFVSGSYWGQNTIEQVCYNNTRDIVFHIFEHHEEFGVENTEDASQIVTIIATMLLATAWKARGGRALKHDESIRIEKFSKALSGGDDEDEGPLEKIGL